MKLLKPAHIPMRVLPCLIGAAIVLGACNAEKSDEPAYEPALSVAVQGFSLTANSKVMANLDSVFFSIDLDHAVIFNADSLPVGTNINKLVPKITFPAAVSKAEIKMSGGTTRTGIVNYKTSPTDSIDFTGDVTLTLSTEDGALSKTYTLKVNVHKMVADSLMWDKTALAPLPAATASPHDQRTVAMDGKTYTMVEEADGSYTMAVSSDLAAATWTKTPLSLPFTPQVRSLTASDSNLFILDADGSLYSSADGRRWQSAGITWTTIIGAFGDVVLGVSQDAAGRYYHDIHPRPTSYSPVEIPEDFPIEGLSNFNSFTSKWASDPIGQFTGGRRGNTVYGDTWTYDGTEWAKISNTPLPAMQDVLVVPYFNYRQTTTSWVQTEFSVLLALGGLTQDGSIGRKVYLSYDNGVNWMEAGSLLQLPDYIHSFYQADAVIATSPMDASIGNGWKTRASRRPGDVRRISYFTDGSNVKWDCPYIYMFGGRNEGGSLNPAIWRAVLARLTFAPLF